MTTEELQKLDREHVIYSWKAQGGWKPTVIDHAEGVYMYDTDGRKIMDGCSGLLNINLGHGNRHVLDAMKAQMEKLCFVSPGVRHGGQGEACLHGGGCHPRGPRLRDVHQRWRGGE